MILLLSLCLLFMKTHESTSEFTDTMILRIHQCHIFYAYHVYELIFKTRQYRHSQIFKQFFSKLCNSTKKISFFQQTHSIIIERLGNKFTKSKAKTFFNIYELPIKNFIKANNSYLKECDIFLISNYSKKINGNNDHFVNLCISNYIDIVIEKRILKIEGFNFFIELVQTDQEGFYVQRNNLDNFIYDKQFSYESKTSNLTTENEIKTISERENEPENIAYFEFINICIINFHMQMYENIIAIKTRPEENRYLAVKISELELKFDKVIKKFTGSSSKKDKKIYLELKSLGIDYEYYIQKKNEKLSTFLESYFFHLFKEVENSKELIELSTRCIMKQNTNFYNEYIKLIDFGEDKIYIYLI